MFEAVPPQFLLLLSSPLIVLLPKGIRELFGALVSMTVLALFFQTANVSSALLSVARFDITLFEKDDLSNIFVILFLSITAISMIYNWGVASRLESFAAMFYAGCAVGMVLSGDLISFFVFWESLTIGAVLLLLAANKTLSTSVALRYLLVHVVGGLILMAGLVIYIQASGSIAIQAFTFDQPGVLLMFIGIGVNCGWPLLNAWIPDAYPNATPGGVLYLAAFTTKGAIYALIRMFPGESSLIWIGLAMVLIPLIYAALENDLRKVLVYGIINQVGFMVIGVGVGSALALNGASAHVVSHVLYKSLLFMAVGVVIWRFGSSDIRSIGGLSKSLPWTTAFAIIGVLSMSTPYLCGFVSKSMIISGAGKAELPIPWIVLVIGSAGVFFFCGLKVLFYGFFGKELKPTSESKPLGQGMIPAMCIATIASFIIGVFPHQTLYQLLPFEMKYAYKPYTFSHINGQMLLLTFSTLAFLLTVSSGLLKPSPKGSTLLDIDRLYRNAGSQFYFAMDKSLNGLNSWFGKHLAKGVIIKFGEWLNNAIEKIAHLFESFIKSESPNSKLSRDIKTGALPLSFAANFLAAVLILMIALSLFAGSN